jgi:hypothetical protein
MPNGNVVDISKIKPAHQRFRVANERAIAAALDVEPVVAAVKQHIGSGILLAKRSGNLVNSTSAKYIRTAKGSLIRVQNTAVYAHAQETGSGLYGPKRAKYPIVPKGNYPLSFYWHRKKQHMLLMKVMHPGVKPTHFLEIATDLTFKTRIALLRAGMRTAARNF